MNKSPIKPMITQNDYPLHYKINITHTRSYDDINNLFNEIITDNIEEAVKFMKLKKIQPYVINNEGDTILHFVIKNFDMEINQEYKPNIPLVRKMKKIEYIIKKLDDYGFQTKDYLNFKNKQGCTPLYYILKECYIDIYKYYVKQEANIDYSYEYNNDNYFFIFLKSLVEKMKVNGLTENRSDLEPVIGIKGRDANDKFNIVFVYDGNKYNIKEHDYFNDCVFEYKQINYSVDVDNQKITGIAVNEEYDGTKQIIYIDREIGDYKNFFNNSTIQLNNININGNYYYYFYFISSSGYYLYINSIETFRNLLFFCNITNEIIKKSGNSLLYNYYDKLIDSYSKNFNNDSKIYYYIESIGNFNVNDIKGNDDEINQRVRITDGGNHIIGTRINIDDVLKIFLPTVIE